MARSKKKRKKPSCDLCGEADHKIRRLTVRVDGKREVKWRTCRSCCAVLLVLLRDPRNRRVGH